MQTSTQSRASINRLMQMALGAALLAVCSCRATTEIPSIDEQILFKSGTKSLTCISKRFAKERGLKLRTNSFFAQNHSVQTNRFEGRAFEIVMYNPTKKNNFFVSLYEDKKDTSNGKAARRAFYDLKRALSANIYPACGMGGVSVASL
jgi:hypothetical protein